MPSPSGSASATAQHRAAFLRGQRENLVAIWDQIVTRAGGSVVRVSVEARGEPSADFAEQALASHHQMQALTFRNGDQTKIEAVLAALDVEVELPGAPRADHAPERGAEAA